MGIDGKVIDSFVDHVQQDRLESMHCPLHVVIDHRYYQKIGKRSVAGMCNKRQSKSELYSHPQSNHIGYSSYEK